MVDLLKKAREFGLEIQQSAEFLCFVSAKSEFDDSAEMKKFNRDFDSKREALNNEMAKDGSDHEKITQISEELRDLYSKIHENVVMIKFEKARCDFEELVKEIVHVITVNAYGEMPMNSFGNCSSHCGNSCESCGEF
ncbi:MAG: YlbF family regulator [Candidatus Improbicoccus devescovinae]|nr:MAG: YlbF family regulator [Candidatus Improbicoccus devescovinae]